MKLWLFGKYTCVEIVEVIRYERGRPFDLVRVVHASGKRSLVPASWLYIETAP